MPSLPVNCFSKTQGNARRPKAPATEARCREFTSLICGILGSAEKQRRGAKPLERLSVQCWRAKTQSESCRSSKLTIAEKDSPRLVRDVVFVKPAMQYRTRIIEDLARCRKPFRIRSDSEILHENLRPIDKCKHIGRCRRRKEFLPGHDQIHRRRVRLHHEFPGCNGAKL